MEKLIIKFTNGEPDGHPMLYSNFVQCFPDIDPENLPDNFRYFERHQRPDFPSPYHTLVSDQASYILIDDKVHDHWEFQLMSAEEKQAKIDEVLAMEHSVGWTFVEETCSWEPPFPAPDDGQPYRWDDDTQTWVLKTL